MLFRTNALGLQFVLSVDHNGENTDATRIAHNGKSITVDWSLEIISHCWYDWQMKGRFIQDAFPMLSPGEREFIQSGITPEEWNAIFKTAN